MNQRIQELAKQIYGTEATDQEIEFAELIIKECSNVAADHDALDIYEEIREHFGIKNV